MGDRLRLTKRIDYPPVVSDPEGPCPVMEHGPPHAWEGQWSGGRITHEVCRYCGGRKP